MATTSPNPYLARAVEWLLGLIGLAAMVFGATIVLVPMESSKYCRSAMRKDYPRLSDSSVVVRTIWAPTQGNHWLSAVVVQPYDLNADRVTIICHFQSTNYVLSHTEILAGDKTDALKETSLSNFDPRTWFQ